MFDEFPPAPSTPPPAPAPRLPQRRTDGLALLLIGALLGAVIGIGGARAVVPIVSGTAPAAGSTAPAANAEQAIKDVIEKANDAQAAAFTKNDPSAMRGTSTDAHYQEMVKVNADLASGGVRSIELVKIAFGDVTVSRSMATATTTETWRSTYSDGTVDQSTDVNDYSLVLQSGAWKIDSNTQPGNGVTAPTQPQTPSSTTVRGTSRNWSGYVSTGGTYTSVSGTWVVAKPDPKVMGIDATWVGIGGANTTDLIQAGTEATVNGDGSVSYDAWTEVLPQSTHTVALSVSGGDTVSVGLTEQSAGLWLVELKDVTTGRSFSTTIRYASSKSSAEWIEEAPSLGRSVAPLDRFGSVTFSAAGAVIDGKHQDLNGASAKAVTMANGADEPLAVPSAIGKDGSSFTVTRTSTPATSNLGGPGRRRG